MRRSKKSYLLDLPEISSDIEVEEEKTITHEGHEYNYRVEKYTMFKSYYAIIVTGGPYKIRATTTCKGTRVKTKIKALILTLKHR